MRILTVDTSDRSIVGLVSFEGGVFAEESSYRAPDARRHVEALAPAVERVTAGAPYDVVISAAASESISKDWLRQMAVGGRLVAPVKAPDSDVQTLHVVDRVSPDEWSLTVLDPVRFVPLRAGVAR